MLYTLSLHDALPIFPLTGSQLLLQLLPQLHFLLQLLPGFRQLLIQKVLGFLITGNIHKGTAAVFRTPAASADDLADQLDLAAASITTPQGQLRTRDFVA